MALHRDAEADRHPEGQRLTSQTDDDPARELRRVVARLASLGSRAPTDVVHPELQHLADIAADAEVRDHRAVPQLAPHALADQLTVLTDDALAVASPETAADIGRRLAALRRSL